MRTTPRRTGARARTVGGWVTADSSWGGGPNQDGHGCSVAAFIVKLLRQSAGPDGAISAFDVGAPPAAARSGARDTPLPAGGVPPPLTCVLHHPALPLDDASISRTILG